MALTTLLNYKNAVTAAGYDSVTSAAAILDAINEARQTLFEERRWSWRGTVDSTTLVLAYDTPSEALNGITDLAYVDAVRLEIGTTYPEIAYLTPEDLRDKEHVDRTPGQPLYWTEAAGQLRFWPSPDKAYTVAIDYIRTMTDLAVDADVDSDIPPAFKALVKWKAAELLAYRTRDLQASASAGEKYTAELRRKLGQENITQRQTSQQVLTARDRWY